MNNINNNLSEKNKIEADLKHKKHVKKLIISIIFFFIVIIFFVFAYIKGSMIIKDLSV